MTTSGRLQEPTDLSLQLLVDLANSYAVMREMKLSATTLRDWSPPPDSAFTPTTQDDASGRADESRSQDYLPTASRSWQSERRF